MCLLFHRRWYLRAASSAPLDEIGPFQLREDFRYETRRVGGSIPPRAITKHVPRLADTPRRRSEPTTPGAYWAVLLGRVSARGSVLAFRSRIISSYEYQTSPRAGPRARRDPTTFSQPPGVRA